MSVPGCIILTRRTRTSSRRNWPGGTADSLLHRRYRIISKFDRINNCWMLIVPKHAFHPGARRGGTTMTKRERELEGKTRQGWDYFNSREIDSFVQGLAENYRWETD